MRFRTKPVEVEAVQFTGDNWDEMAEWTNKQFTHSYNVAPVNADIWPGVVYDMLHGTWIGVKPGQWIVNGVKGEFYPCDNETFFWKYERVEG